MDKSKRLLIARRRLVLVGIVMLPIVFGVRFLITENIKRNNQREQAIVWTAVVEEICRDIEQMDDIASIDVAVNKFSYYENKKTILESTSRSYFNEFTETLRGCASIAKSKVKVVTTTTRVPIKTQVPIERSDAESLAEGNTCSKQWRYARAETLSGTSDDSRLRATVYACKTWDDWFLGAVENGEYNDYLLAVICASEPNAPLCG